jgi:hypothetical protein
MSKAQGDGYKTWTDIELNKYRDEIFFPALNKAIDEKRKVFELGNDLTIVTIEVNKVKRRGFKLKSIEIIGKRYYIYLYQNYRKEGEEVLTHSVIDDDKDKANQEFLRIKALAI